MRKSISPLIIIVFFTSCQVHLNKKITGNGNFTTEDRNITDVSRIRVRGAVNVELAKGTGNLEVKADQNLLKYIITEEEDGWLIIRTKNNVGLKTKNPVTVLVTTHMIEAIEIYGSGNVMSQNKFSGASKLDIDIAGSGDVLMEVNTPKVIVDIMGSGNVSLSGETMRATVDIKGSGDYRAEQLLTESTDIDIMGSGDATVFADATLKADIMGSGSVFYKGKANIRSDIRGSGRVKPLE